MFCSWYSTVRRLVKQLGGDFRVGQPSAGGLGDLGLLGGQLRRGPGGPFPGVHGISIDELINSMGGSP
jgi:hypothetical protein